MESKRIQFLLIFAVIFAIAECKVFTRCQLTRELLRNNFPRTFISNSLLDEDIKEDSLCAQKVFDQEGFKYWSKWGTRCKGQTLPDVEKCPEWLNL
ncbi:hypothetical protein RR48_03138 [Papilio machaon]|uniref:lysozyme n=1 Tax=Papilio machaon TaxID=76193 RepID=A0A0N1PI92_PAPMA|nr:hypothetical protein RR48_03138 [Papilio machaon]